MLQVPKILVKVNILLQRSRIDMSLNSLSRKNLTVRLDVYISSSHF